MTPIIEFKGVYKKYTLGRINQKSLAEDIYSFFRQLTGKMQPNEIDTNNDFWAIRDVSFKIYPGETIGIVGNNGAGKSTLLRLLSRITTPTKGQILVNGTVSSLLSLGTGFHPELTGRENIYLNAAILRVKKQDIENKIDDIINFTEIENFIDTPVKRYSSGMYSRLAFAIAIHTKSDVIILDEILSVGDMNFNEKSTKSIKGLVKQDNRTAIIASHNLHLIETECDRAMLIHKGKLYMFDNPKKVIQAYTKLNEASADFFY